MPNFIDEPTSGLDIEARTEILDLLRDYLIERIENELDTSLQ